MQKIRGTSTLTVYFDGQFWVGVFERIDGCELSACRVVFGAEPSNEEIEEFVCKYWNKLRFAKPIRIEAPPKSAGNPKRRWREAARELKQRGPSTKAQQAISEEREASAIQRKADARERREQAKQEKYEQHRKKQKSKRRGH